MGRKSREKKERRMLRNKPIFHMAIGAAPVTKFSFSDKVSQKVSLENETKLVKAALLYSDKVTLYSMATSMLALLLGLKTLTTRQKLDFLGTLAPQLVKESEREALQQNLPLIFQMMDNRDKLTTEQLLFLINFESQIETLWQPAMAKFEQFAEDAGVSEIDAALKTGILNVHMLGLKRDETLKYARMDDIISGKKQDSMLLEYVNEITKIVIDGDAYPLFDDMTGNLIGNMIKEERINVSESRALRGKHSILAKNLLEKLPLFDKASIDEIMDIRSELDKPLVNFRQAIIGFAGDIKTVAWDKDFPVEADQVFYQKVAPTILELEERVKQTKSLSNFVARLASRPSASGGTLSVLISQALALPSLASTALTLERI